MKERIQHETASASVYCPRCGERHISGYPIMDEYVECECGNAFYAFSDGRMEIVMDPKEASDEKNARRIRSFVKGVGHAADIPDNIFQGQDGQYYLGAVLYEGLENELESVLAEYQMQFYGKYYVTLDDLAGICECFKKKNDLLLKRYKDRTCIFEVKSVDQSEMRLHRKRKENKKKTGVPLAMLYANSADEATPSLEFGRAK